MFLFAFVYVFALSGIATAKEEFANFFQKSSNEAHEKYQHLQDEDEHNYHLKTADFQSRQIFQFIDKNQDVSLDQVEMNEFARLIINNTEGAEDFAKKMLLSDENNDSILTFEEFHKPEVIYGDVPEKTAGKHQHKQGQLHHQDPYRRNQEL